MSYILDALRKQEAEANPGGFTQHTPVQASRRTLWYSVICIALLLNAALLGWLLLPETQPADSPVQTPVSAPAPVVTTSEATVTQPPPANVEAEPAHIALPPTETLPEPTPPAPKPIRRVRIGDIPAKDRADFPGLVYSTHIYGTDDDLRAVVVNGNRLQEGAEFRGLKLQEITETGVVWAYKNYLVEVTLVDL